MIMTVEQLKQYITTDKSDQVLEDMLQALESMIRGYTNNRFHKNPAVRIKADIIGGVFISDSLIPFKVGDTVNVTVGDKAADCGVYTVAEVSSDTTFTVKESIEDIASAKVSLVEYKADVRMGVAKLIKWDLEHKVGVQSETISRHSVTYVNMDGDNSIMSYPKPLMGFLKPYMKARF